MRIHLPKNDIDVTQWEAWFAWHPVFVGEHVVWLETIERRWVPYPPGYMKTGEHEYRFRGEGRGPGEG